MELFNSLFRDTEALLEKGSPKVWDYSERDCWIDIGSSELVLQKDAAYELGASGRGSANYVLFTSSPELVNKDQVLLYGPDLKDIRGDCDFARIVLLRVGVLEQVRVSKKALKKGISFRSIGASYIKAYKKDINVLNATVIFLTAPGYDYAAMKDCARKASDITNTLTSILEGLPTDCSVCALKGICEEVEGMKELHFGVGDKGADKGHGH